MTVEAIRAADALSREGIAVEVIDVRTLRPLDDALILQSVRKTGRLIVADTGWKNSGFGAEVVARVAEQALGHPKNPPKRTGLPDCPCPSTPALANHYYPRAIDIVQEVRRMCGSTINDIDPSLVSSVPLDVPDVAFTDPF